MFCTKCGIEVRENAKFCSECGNNLFDDAKLLNNIENTTKNGFMKTIDKIGKKRLLSIVAVIAVVIVAISIVSKSTSSIIGTWENYDGREISFSENGQFTYGSHYGTYTIYDDNKLVLIYKDFDWLTKQDTYYWQDDWYVDGDKLMFNDTEYYRK